MKLSRTFGLVALLALYGGAAVASSRLRDANDESLSSVVR